MKYVFHLILQTLEIQNWVFKGNLSCYEHMTLNIQGSLEVKNDNGISIQIPHIAFALWVAIQYKITGIFTQRSRCVWEVRVKKIFLIEAHTADL